MNFYTIAEFLSNRLGIANEIFQLNFEFPEERDYRIIENKNITNHFYLSGYEYWSNTGEGWKSIVLFFPKAIQIEIISVLNEYLHANGEDLIDENNLEDYTLNEDDFILILVQNNDQYLKLELALKE